MMRTLAWIDTGRRLVLSLKISLAPHFSAVIYRAHITLTVLTVYP